MIQTVQGIINGSINIDTFSEKKLEELLRLASDRYYNTHESILSDAMYDTLIETLARLNDENLYLSTIGAPVKTKKVNLPFPMFSLQKVKPGGRVLSNWLQRHLPPYVISDKLDGTSAMLTWTFDSDRNSAKLSVFSRGNGIVGSDLTHLAKHILAPACRRLPRKLQNITDGPTIAIRGEIMISKQDFELFRQGGAVNARSVTNGFVNSKDVSLQVASKTRFVAYEIVMPRLAKSVQMSYLEECGIPTVWNTIDRQLDEKALIETLDTRMRDSPFDIDGLVIEAEGPHLLPINKNPEYAFAFKTTPNGSEKITQVTDVLWETSAHGRIVPKIQYEPVVINGVRLTYASGKNARNIVNNGLGPGAVIEVIHSGSVIPEITRTLKKVEPKLPNFPFDWSTSGADIVLKPSERDFDPTYQIKTIVRFFKVVGIDGIREGLVRKFFEHGFTSIQSFLQADENAFSNVPGTGITTARKLVDTIRSSLQNVDMATLMMASNTFGSGIGEKKLQVVFEQFPHLLDSPPELDAIANLPGFNLITAEKISNGISGFKAFLNSSPQIAARDPRQQESNKNGPLKGQVYVFTGFRDKILMKKIMDLGGTVATSVSNRTTAVIFRGAGQGIKLEKAQALNIPTIDVDVFASTLP